jgi:hypothetical protein
MLPKKCQKNVEDIDVLAALRFKKHFRQKNVEDIDSLDSKCCFCGKKIIITYIGFQEIRHFWAKQLVKIDENSSSLPYIGLML